MTTISAARSEMTVDLDWMTISVRMVGQDPGTPFASYRITYSDAETGRMLGSISVPATPDGRPPRLTVGEIVELVSRYRAASVYVEIAAERLVKITKRISDSARLHDKSWLRRVPKSLLVARGMDDAYSDYAGSRP